MSDPSNSTESPDPQDALSATFAFLVLRVWLGLRSLLTGIEKFSATVSKEVPMDVEEGGIAIPGLVTEVKVKEYGFEHYHGIPEPLMEKFLEEPLIPGWALSLYGGVLGYLLIGLGITLLAGIYTRVSLFVSGLVYCSLTAGLILLKQDAGIAWLGMHIALVVAGLMLAKHNRYAFVNKL